MEVNQWERERLCSEDLDHGLVTELGLPELKVQRLFWDLGVAGGDWEVRWR